MGFLQVIGQTITRSRVSNGQTRNIEGTRDGAVYTADYLRLLGLEGRIFVSSDADGNDQVTGQTSFADTLCTLLLRVPTGTTAIPLSLELQQTGSLAGAVIFATIEIEAADPYASGGTSEKVYYARTDNPVTANCTLYSTPTITTGHYGIQVASWNVGPDISSAEGALQRLTWTPNYPITLVGPASLKLYSYAGTTGPTWLWSVAWAEVPSSSIT